MCLLFFLEKKEHATNNKTVKRVFAPSTQSDVTAAGAPGGQWAVPACQSATYHSTSPSSQGKQLLGPSQWYYKEHLTVRILF